MSREMTLLDQELAAVGPEGIAERAAFARETYHSYGFTPDTAIIIGGSAFALAGIDARVEYGDETHGFDLDVVVTSETIVRLYCQDGRPVLHEDPIWYFNNLKDDPHMDAFRMMDNRSAYHDYHSLLGDSGVSDSMRALTPIKAAELRLDMRSRRGKAALGVVKAHASAFSQEMELADDPAWQALVTQAHRIAMYSPLGDHVEWFDQLAAHEGGIASHPAFPFLPGLRPYGQS